MLLATNTPTCSRETKARFAELNVAALYTASNGTAIFAPILTMCPYGVAGRMESLLVSGRNQPAVRVRDDHDPWCSLFVDQARRKASFDEVEAATFHPNKGLELK